VPMQQSISTGTIHLSSHWTNYAVAC